MKTTIVLVSILILQCLAEDKVKIKDSYLEAYYISKTNLASGKNDRIDKYSPFYDNSGPENNYGPPHRYPQSNYGPPHGFSDNYGPPEYGPPAYGPPAYGSPAYGGAPSASFPMSFPQIPHVLLGLLEKIHLKLNIFTVLKLILKLVIFKKIVSFIAILFLLLFIPKFKPPKVGDMDDIDSRALANKNSKADEHINILTNYVITAVEKYSGNKNSTCKGIICENSKILRDIDNKYSYKRLLTLYSQES